MVDKDLAPGAELEFTLTVPAEITLGTEVLIRAQSRVLRAERRKEQETTGTGVAVMIERFDIIRAKPGPS